MLIDQIILQIVELSIVFRTLTYIIVIAGSIGVLAYIIQILTSIAVFIFSKIKKKHLPDWYRGFNLPFLTEIKKYVSDTKKDGAKYLGIIFYSAMFVFFWIAVLFWLEVLI